MLGLEEVAAAVDGRVEREAGFAAIGYLGHRGDALLVPFFAAEAAPALAAQPNIAAVVTTEDLAALVPAGPGILVVRDAPMEALIRIHIALVERHYYPAHPPSAFGADCAIDPQAHVAEAGVTMGDRVVVGPKAVVLPGTILESDVHIGPGSVIGCDGFEVRPVGGRPLLVPHVGGVRVEAGARIFANCCVARALYAGHTVLGRESTLDNLVAISHNVTVGARCRMGAGVTIGGSSTIGDDVWIGPNATVSSRIAVGDRASISLGAVVTRDVAADARVSGNFAIAHERFLEHMRTVR